jgi:hypothetical protein
MSQSQVIYHARESRAVTKRQNESPAQKRSYKAQRLKPFEPATPEQLKDIPLRVPLIARDLAICELLLFYRVMREEMIERLLFWEPGVSYTKAPERLLKLYHHRFVDRLKVNGEMVYVLLARGQEEIARQRGIEPKSLDWEPDHNRRSHHHWAHLLGNNEVRILIYLGIERLQSLYILNQAPLDLKIRDAARQLIETGWSRSRVWEKINYLLYIQQELPQVIADPAAWLTQAVEKNIRQPKGFEAEKFVSPLSAVNEREEGFILRDWLTDLDLSRLKAAKKLKVEYTPPLGQQRRFGVVELDDEFEVVTPWLDRGKRKSFVLMGEYDNLKRTLEATTPPKQDKDDPTFANKMAKCVAMLNDGVYTKVRGSKLDKIFIVCNGGPRAVENRLQVIRNCGGENAFFVVSLEVLRQLRNPADILLAPIWRKAGDSQETYYPLIGQSGLERFRQLLKRNQIAEGEIAKAEAEIQREAKRRFYQTILSELNEAQAERVKQARERGRDQASTLLHSFYAQRWGQTHAQGLAIFADKVAQQRYEAKLQQLQEQKRGYVEEKAR